MRTKKKMRIISSLLLLIVFFALNYPLATDLINGHETKVQYSSYIEQVEDTDAAAEFENVKEYNQTLINNESRFSSEKTDINYPSLLNIQGSIMAYVDVPTAGIVSVPVYHYATTEVLQEGAGHIAGSSLPSAENGVHIAISGHSGMSGMKMFSGLTSVELGDEFTLSCLDKVFTYKVINIDTVLPDDMSLLEIDDDRNLCSLITCTPIGLNTHRLVVTAELENVDTIYTYKQVSRSKLVDLGNRFATYELVMSGISLIILFILVKDLITFFRKPVFKLEFIYLDDDLLDPRSEFLLHCT